MKMNRVKKLKDGAIISNGLEYIIVSSYNKEQRKFETYNSEGRKIMYSLASFLRREFILKLEGGGKMIGRKVEFKDLYSENKNLEIDEAFNLIISKLSELEQFNTNQTSKYVSFKKSLAKYAFLEVWVQKKSLKIYTRKEWVPGCECVEEVSKNRVMNCFINIHNKEDVEKNWDFIELALINYTE